MAQIFCCIWKAPSNTVSSPTNPFVVNQPRERGQEGKRAGESLRKREGAEPTWTTGRLRSFPIDNALGVVRVRSDLRQLDEKQLVKAQVVGRQADLDKIELLGHDGLPLGPDKIAELKLTDQESKVLNAIQMAPTQLDEILVKTGLPAQRVLSTISVLEMRKLIKRISGTTVARF